MARQRKGEAVHGWLALDKPAGMSSNAALLRVRYLFNARKAGHAGTLDPLACGVLPVAFGEATKTISYMMAAEKSYEFSVRWGESRDTLDCEGVVTERSTLLPSPQQIDEALSGFVGEREQVPPVYSALRVNGERACDRVRRGEVVELAARQVRLLEAKRLHGTAQETYFYIRCGKGYYVRSLARDLALKLGICGHVGSLRRLSVGSFSQKDAKPLDMLETNCHKGSLQACLFPVEAGLVGMPACIVSRSEADCLRAGRSVSVVSERWKFQGGVGREAGVCLVLEGGTPVALARMALQGLHPVRVFNL